MLLNLSISQGKYVEQVCTRYLSFKVLALDSALTASDKTHLQANCQVHSTAKWGADSPWVEAQVFKQLWERLCEGDSGTFFCNNHTGPYSGQIQSSCLQIRTVILSQPAMCSLWVTWIPFIQNPIGTMDNSTGLFISRAIHNHVIN
jgi:hypothetical protein